MPENCLLPPTWFKNASKLSQSKLVRQKIMHCDMLNLSTMCSKIWYLISFSSCELASSPPLLLLLLLLLLPPPPLAGICTPSVMALPRTFQAGIQCGHVVVRSRGSMQGLATG